MPRVLNTCVMNCKSTPFATARGEVRSPIGPSTHGASTRRALARCAIPGALEQVIHEFDFLVTSWDEWYFVQIIFGQEFAINLGGPEIDGYLKWLKDNNSESWLYMAKNVGLYPKPKRADTA